MLFAISKLLGRAQERREEKEPEKELDPSFSAPGPASELFLP
jgi:hypothetical protein